MYGNIDVYEDEGGKSEILDYFNRLVSNYTKDNRIKSKKIDMLLRLLSEYGLTLKEPYIKHLDGEIWELRPNKSRILFACIDNNNFVLLSIFRKQTQKTPRKEIKKAKKLLEDYKRRREING